MPLRYGKKPASFDKRDLRYADFRPKAVTLPSIPPTFGHARDFTRWKMLGNGPAEVGDELPASWTAAQEGCGDCAWAGPGHEVMESNYNSGRAFTPMTAAAIIEQYSAYSGYNPETGENDNGSDVREVLQWRATKGLKDASGMPHKIGPYVALEPQNLQHLYEACFLFECVGIGFEVPESAQQQFAEGKPWSVVPGAQIVGGHYVPIMGRPDSSHLAFITWAERAVMTNGFYETYNDEAWAYVSPEMFAKATGKDWEGYSEAQLEQYLHAVTQTVPYK